MHRRTPEQIRELEPESLSDWQLIRLSLVCGKIDAVCPPDDVGIIQRVLVWFENLGSKDASTCERAIGVFIVCIAIICLGVFISILEIIGTPWWGRYVPLSIFIITSFALTYAGKKAVITAGGDVFIVEGYKRRVAEKAAKRAAERRKQYRPISAQELES
jgi:hypothetical protein